ncbi:hypothetical protein HAX54_042429, partial [Datura stramonium]|nr:hypothetical protein [Datura stramonium]
QSQGEQWIQDIIWKLLTKRSNHILVQSIEDDPIDCLRDDQVVGEEVDESCFQLVINEDGLDLIEKEDEDATSEEEEDMEEAASEEDDFFNSNDSQDHFQTQEEDEEKDEDD